MKRNRTFPQRAISIVLVVVFMIQLCSCGIGNEAAPSRTASLSEGEEYPFYLGSMDTESTITLYFADENKDIPYIDMDTVKELLERFYHEVNGDEKFALTLTKKGATATFTRKNDNPMTVDADKNIINFFDFDAFFVPSWSDTVIDVRENYGNIPYLKSVPEMSYSILGPSVDLELGNYGIDILTKNGECYVPLQTISDFCLSMPCYTNLVYNHIGVYARLYGMDEDADFIQKIYDAPKGERSPALTEFTYNELCMVLDYLYGPREKLGIKHFDQYFTDTGLKYELISTDPKIFTTTLVRFLYVYTDDGHCRLQHPSYQAGEDYVPEKQFGYTRLTGRYYTLNFSEALFETFPGGLPGYEEIGNTAYISFSAFKTLEEGADYYKNPPTADTDDTVGLCLYAFSQITRPNSPIENVVLDLSNNSGGDTTTASFVLGMFLGTASLCIKDTLTGAYMNETFMSDSNLDGEFDEDDSLEDYNLYCLISPSSFSCANLVPSFMKSSHKVTILGQTSGGGAFIVLPLSLADGTLLQVASNRELSYIKNGVLTDVDSSAVPDFYIDKPASFYDRISLTEYINSIL